MVTQRPLEPWFWVRILVGQRASNKMEIKIINSANHSKRMKSIFLSSIYFFILALTSFHHHSIDLADKVPFYKQHQQQSHPYSYSAENCPIVNFTNSGFNSFGISPFPLTIEFVRDFGFFIKTKYFHSLEIYPSNYLRGPPSPFFI
jgi:hypothetical protein